MQQLLYSGYKVATYTEQFDHDEYDGRIIKGVREEMSKLLKDALKEVEVEYKLNVKLETQTKFGTSWAEVH